MKTVKQDTALLMTGQLKEKQKDAETLNAAGLRLHAGL